MTFELRWPAEKPFKKSTKPDTVSFGLENSVPLRTQTIELPLLATAAGWHTHSSRLLPLMRGFLRNLPACTRLYGESVMRSPSIEGSMIALSSAVARPFVKHTTYYMGSYDDYVSH